MERHIFLDLLKAFLLGIFALNFVLMTERVLRVAMVFAQVGASPMDLLKLIIYLQPQITMFTAPLSLLLATLFTYGRMIADNEFVVLRTGGMTFGAMVRPVIKLAVACCVLGLAMSFVLLPQGALRIALLIKDVLTTRAPNSISEGIFTTRFPGVVIHVNSRDAGGDMRGIFIYDERNPKQPMSLYAESGRISSLGGKYIEMDLQRGSMHIVGSEDTTKIEFGRYRLSVPIPMRAPILKYNELSPDKLITYAYHMPEGRDRYEPLIEFHKRLTLPLLSILIAIFAVPLAALSGKTGKMSGMALGLGIFAVYYTMLTYGESLVRAGKVPHYVGSWAAFVALGAFASYLYKREARR